DWISPAQLTLPVVSGGSRMQWNHHRRSALRVRFLLYVLRILLKIGARQFVHKFAVKIGPADDQQIDSDRMHGNILAQVSPPRNQHSLQKRIIQPETINFWTINVDQTGAAAKRGDYRFLRRSSNHDHGVNLSLQEFFHCELSLHQVAAYIGSADSHAVDQAFSKCLTNAEKISQHHSLAAETLPRIHRRACQKVNGGGMNQCDAAKLIHGLRVILQ